MKLLKLVPDNTNIKFLRWRVPFYTISLLLMAASIALNDSTLGIRRVRASTTQQATMKTTTMVVMSVGIVAFN